MGWVVLLGWLLVGAALLEFLLLRFLLRLGPVLPPGDAVTTLLTWVSQAGLLFLNVSVVTGLALLAVLLVVLPREKKRPSVALLWAAAALALGVSVTRLAGPYVSDVAREPGFILAMNAASMLVVLLMAASAVAIRRGLLPMGVLGAAYSAALLHYAAAIAPAVGATAWGRGVSLAVAEALVLLIGPAVLWTLRPSWRLGAVVTATAVAAIYLALAIVRPWIAATLVIWDFGFTSFLPSYVYALALWVLVYAALSLAGKGRRGALASMGLALVALGGLRLDYAHYSLLAMAGMVLMALALTESSQARCLAAGLIAATRATGKPSVETAVGAGNPNAR